MSQDNAVDDVERRFQEIHEARQRLSDSCDKRGLAQLMREGRRLAKREKRFFDYLSFTYTLQGNLDVLQEAHLDRELSVELIGLLEDEDKARAFGPNFDSDFYEYKRSWMLPLSYKSLADVTGEMEGYNSPGMHACIAEGINVCRRMNNRDGIIYFREFAFEVYQAADDLDLALHFARETIALQSLGSDRKVASADDAARALGLQGRLQEAVEQVLEGFGYCETFHNPYLAKLNYLPLLRETCAVAGRTDLLAEFPEVRWPHEVKPGEEGNYLVYAPRGSDTSIEAMADRSLAVEAACAGDLDKAIALVEPWANLALQNQVVHPLLENRCRLMALYRLAGRMDDLRAMAKSTEPIAKQANDWLTLRTIKCMLDENFPVNPLASINPADCGPYAPAVVPQSAVQAVDANAAEQEEESAEDDVPKTPLAPFFHALFERLEVEDEQAHGAVVDQILQLAPAAIEHPLDCEQALNILNFLIDSKREKQVIQWSEQALAHFPGESGIASMSAVLLDTVCELVSGDGQTPTTSPEEIKKLFKRALDIDAECGRSFSRAGLHFLNSGDLGEAERCLARAFRLNRQSASSALGLADVYANTERPRDALEVLDMALREGCEEPRLGWHAAMHANSLGQFEVMLTYLNWFAERVPDHKWMRFFRALALVELKRAPEALEEIAIEREGNPEAGPLLNVLTACCMSQLERVDEFRSSLQQVMSVPLRELDGLSPAELARLMTGLWLCTSILPADDPLKEQLETLLLQACLLPDQFFDEKRTKNVPPESATEVRLFRVILGQFIDGQWSTSPGCLAGEEPWLAYNILWCALAEDEEKAIQMAQSWQSRCNLGEIEVIDVQISDERYKDLPGVVSQGPRGGFVKKEQQAE